MTENIHGSIAVIGVGLVVLGAGLGIGRLAASAMEGIARQPEVASKIQTAMLIAVRSHRRDRLVRDRSLYHCH